MLDDDDDDIGRLSGRLTSVGAPELKLRWRSSSAQPVHELSSEHHEREDEDEDVDDEHHEHDEHDDYHFDHYDDTDHDHGQTEMGMIIVQDHNHACRLCNGGLVNLHDRLECDGI